MDFDSSEAEYLRRSGEELDIKKYTYCMHLWKANVQQMCNICVGFASLMHLEVDFMHKCFLSLGKSMQSEFKKRKKVR